MKIKASRVSKQPQFYITEGPSPLNSSHNEVNVLIGCACLCSLEKKHPSDCSSELVPLAFNLHFGAFNTMCDVALMYLNIRKYL